MMNNIAIDSHSFDFNEHFGSHNGGFHQFYPGWTDSDMMEKWKQYLELSLDDEDEIDPSFPTLMNSPRKVKPAMSLPKNDWGEPRLPDDILKLDDTREHLSYRKDVIRAWLTGFYSKFCRVY